MRHVRVVNRTRNRLLAERAELASTPWTRFRGLMGRTSLAPGAGLVLQPGGGIHTCFMRIPIDVLHLDRDGRVTHVVPGIRPWRLGPLLVGNRYAIELPAGAAVGTERGDEVAIESV